MRGHMLEVEFLTLDQKTFDNLQDLFTKYKDLLSQLKACGVDKSKEEKQMVITILSIGAELIRPRSFSGYQQKVSSSLERWHFHLL